MTCHLCGSSDLEVIRDKVRHGIARKVLRCLQCSLVQLEPVPADLDSYYREEYRKDYTPKPGQLSSPSETFEMYLPFMEERVGRVRNFLDPSMRVLEIGCATGHFLEAIKPFVRERVGLELNADHAAFVRDQLGLVVHTQPIELTDELPGSFDVVFLFHVLEHMPDPTSFLVGLKRYLTPRGRIYIEVPNVDDALIAPYAIPGYASFYYREPHLYYFSSETFAQLFRNAGYLGEIEMVQRYSLANHMHWVTCGTPMASAEAGMQKPTLLPGGREPADGFETELTTWLANVDDQYRALLKRHQKAESIAFSGVPTP